jgi:hypothetical protein
MGSAVRVARATSAPTSSMTADRSPLGHRADPAQVRNFRVPKANLEGVYGAGPVGSPYLYGKDDPAKLLLSPMGGDVPRTAGHLRGGATGCHLALPARDPA